MAVKRGLGRGLNDLLSVSEDEAKQAKKDAKAIYGAGKTISDRR